MKSMTLAVVRDSASAFHSWLSEWSTAISWAPRSMLCEATVF